MSNLCDWALRLINQPTLLGVWAFLCPKIHKNLPSEGSALITVDNETTMDNLVSCLFMKKHLTPCCKFANLVILRGQTHNDNQ